MSAAFLHGVETVDVLSGSRPIRQVKSAVIGLVGTAPIHHLLAANRKVNETVLVLSDVDAGKLGAMGVDVSGYTIPDALDAIYDQGGATVILINVFDPATHKTAVAAADLDIAADKTIVLADKDIISAVVKAAGGAGVALVEGTDYSIDRVKGVITVLAGGALAAAAKANVAYDKANPAAVVEADVIGTVDAGGNRTGAQAWLGAYNKFGFYPKVLIAPGWSTTSTMAAALEVLAAKAKCRAVALIDAPIGTTRDEAIAGRGPAGAINFNFSDERLVPCYPNVKVGAALRPYSSVLAGVIAATDDEIGYWRSPSNRVIKGVDGVEFELSASLSDPTCDVNALNEVGIVTVFNSFGTGLRTWGNRSSAFPASTAITNFIACRRVVDMVDEAIELSTLQHMDGPITDVLITAVLEDANEFMRTLIGRGALVDGSHVEFNPAKNPAAQLAAGQIVFTKVFCPPPPAERFTYEDVIDTNLLAKGS